MTHTTQCPSCQTRFRVTDDQLNVAGGLVRCGRCSHVFNAMEALDAPPPPPPPAPPVQAEPPKDDFELELPDFDPLGTPDLTPPPAAPAPSPAPMPKPAASPIAEPAMQQAEPQPEQPLPTEEQAAVSAEDLDAFQRALNDAMHPPVAPIGNPFDHEHAELAEPAPAPRRNPRAELPEPPVYREEFAIPAEPKVGFTKAAKPAKPKKPWPKLRLNVDWRRLGSRLLNGTFAVLGTLGVLVLVGQLTYYNRTRIAAEVPELRSPLEKACAHLGCTVPWPTDADLIRTEWSEMAFIPDHSNLIQLSATLKNHAPYPQAFPVMELTLKDSEDQVLVRRSFAPNDYLKPDDKKLGRFNPNTEVKVVVRLDVGKLKTMGYSLFWYYP
jgi:predicted Zn finger-like uncharacterized protein